MRKGSLIDLPAAVVQRGLSGLSSLLRGVTQQPGGEEAACTSAPAGDAFECASVVDMCRHSLRARSPADAVEGELARLLAACEQPGGPIQALLAAVLSAYADWRPGSALTRRVHHPPSLLRVLCDAAGAAADAAKQCSDKAVEEAEQALAALRLVSRSATNRRALCALGLLATLVRLLSTPLHSSALRLLLELVEADAGGAAEAPLASLLPLCDPAPLAAPSPGTASASESAGCARCAVEAGAVHAALLLLDDYASREPAARALALLLCETGGVQALLDSSSGGVEALVERVGREDAKPDEAALRLQLLSLELAARACVLDRDALRRARAAGLFSRLALLLRWAATAWSPPPEEPGEPPLLALVFSVLRSLCAGLSEEVGTSRALAERAIVTVAHAMQQQPTAASWPALQLMSLGLLAEYVRSTPLAVAALRGAQQEGELLAGFAFAWPGAGAGAVAEAAVQLLLAVAAAPAWTFGGVRVDLGFEPEARALIGALATADERGQAALADCLRRLADAAPARLSAACAAASAPSLLAPLLLVSGPPKDVLATLLALGGAGIEAALASPELAAALLRLAVNEEAYGWEQLRVLASSPGALLDPAAAQPLFAAVAAALSDDQDARLVDLLTLAAQSGHRRALARCGAHTALLNLFAACADDSLAPHALSALAELLRGSPDARDRFLLSDELLPALRRRTRPPNGALLVQLARLCCDERADGDAVAEWKLVDAPLRFAPCLLPFLHAAQSAAALDAPPALSWLEGRIRDDPAAQCVAASASVPSALLQWYEQDADAPLETQTALARVLSCCSSLNAVELMGALQLSRRLGAAHRSRIVESLAAAAQPTGASSSPASFFSLPVGGGSLVLQRPLSWPAAGRALALLLWLRVPAASLAPAPAAALLSLRAACGGGILAALSSEGVEVHAWAPGGPPGSAPRASGLLACTLPAGRWVSLALALVPTAEGLSAHLLLDGSRAADALALRLPPGRPALAGLELRFCALGCEMLPPGTTPRSRPLASVLFEGARLFSLAASSDVLALLRARAAGSADASGEEGQDGDSPFLALSAAAVSRETAALVAYSVAPGAPSQRAALSHGVQAHRRVGVAAALQALGGLSALLPLFLDDSDATAAAALRLAARALPVGQLDEGMVVASLLRRSRRASSSLFGPELLSAAREAALSGGKAVAQRLVLDARLWAVIGTPASRTAQAALISSLASALPAQPAALLAPVDLLDALSEDEAPDESGEWQRALLNAACASACAPRPGAAQTAEGAAALDALLGLFLAPDAVQTDSAADAAGARQQYVDELRLRSGEALLSFPALAPLPSLALRGGASLALAACLLSGGRTPGILLLARVQPGEPVGDAACSTSALMRLWPPSAAEADQLAALAVLASGGQLAFEHELGRLKGCAGEEEQGSAPPPLTRPAAILHLLRLLPSAASDVRHCALQRCAWLVSSAAVCAALVSLPDWQQALLPLLAVADAGTAIAGRRLFASLLAHSLLRGGGGNAGVVQLERTAAWAEALHLRQPLCYVLADALEALAAPAVRWGGAERSSQVLAALKLAERLWVGEEGEAQMPDATAVAALTCAAAGALQRLWPALLAEVAAAAAKGGPASPVSGQLRRAAVQILQLWPSGAASGAANASSAAAGACRGAARLTLSLLRYAATADAEEEERCRSTLGTLVPRLHLALAWGGTDAAQLLCSQLLRALDEEGGAPPACAPRAARLLLHTATAAGYLPSASAELEADVQCLDVLVGLRAVLAAVLDAERCAEAGAADAAADEEQRKTISDSVASLLAECEAASGAWAQLAAAQGAAAAAARSAVLGTDRLRRSAREAQRQEEEAAAERRLRNALRSVQGEGRLWATADAAQVTRWKLDREEDPLRRRRRLRRDWKQYSYTPDDAGRLTLGTHASSQAALSDAAQAAAASGALLSKPAADEVQDEGAASVSDAEAHEPAFAEREAAMSSASSPAAGGGSEEMLFSGPALLVTVQRSVAGTLEVTRTQLHFAADAAQAGAPDAPAPRLHWRWPTSRLSTVHCQRYQLQHVALECWHEPGRAPSFIALPSRAACVRACAALLRARPGLQLLDRRRKTEAAAQLLRRWRRRAISSFEFIMQLNTLAGRSYNDLAQYPVFPWLISDYESASLDLARDGSLRDLSFPIGALNSSRRAALVERYDALAGEADAQLPAFHHGSHYSTPGGVLHWLLRLQPFSQLHVALQGGRFDVGDRLFCSVPGAWAGAWSNASDVRELTPEWFCAPEFLLNQQRLPLGRTQAGAQVDDVLLPPWARGEAAAVVRANAAALECDAVSANLGAWVDLVFGSSQRGEKAVERLNVFFHLTYEGAVDLERVEGARERTALADQIAMFGQTPAQIFSRSVGLRDAPLRREPSPLAGSRTAEWEAELSPEPPLELLADVAALPSSPPAPPSPVLLISAPWDGQQGRVLAATASGLAGAHLLLRPAQTRVDVGAFTFGAVPGAAAAEAGRCAYALRPCSPPEPAITRLPPTAAQLSPLHPALVCELPGLVGLLAGGSWDGRLWAQRAGDSRAAHVWATRAHADLVCCVAADAATVATGSLDASVCLWEARAGGAQPYQPRLVLPGHEAAVRCVALCEAMDVLVSASVGLRAAESGPLLLIHSIRTGRLCRSLRTPAALGAPSHLFLSDSAGAILLLLQPPVAGNSQLLSLNVNGLRLGHAASDEGRLDAATLTRDGLALLAAGERAQLLLFDAATLRLLRRWVAGSQPVTALHVLSDDAVLVGTAGGRLLLWGPPAPPP